MILFLYISPQDYMVARHLEISQTPIKEVPESNKIHLELPHSSPEPDCASSPQQETPQFANGANSSSDSNKKIIQQQTQHLKPLTFLES